MSKTRRVFVYGTLKSGQCMALDGVDGVTLVSAAITTEKFLLTDLGQYPAVIMPTTETADLARRIVGEVYEVDPEMLARLDQYECYPDLYDRITIETSAGKALLYYMPSDMAIKVHGSMDAMVENAEEAIDQHGTPDDTIDWSCS